MKEVNTSMLEALRGEVLANLSPKRAYHILMVEEMTARLCALFCPEYTMQMRAAALLHDITKEKGKEEQLELCRAYGLTVTEAEAISPKTLHARTAAAMIPACYPQFDDPLIVNAVRWHTTGHGGMTLTERILYLADYIDDSRTYQNCLILRRYFFGAAPEAMAEEERLALLRDTLILSYDFTVRDLLEEGKSIAPETVEARNELILERHRANSDT